MQSIKIKDRLFRLLIPNSRIIKAVEAVSEKINHDYNDKKPLFLIVLNGAFMFAGDLLKNITLDCELTFIRLSSYQGMESTEKVTEIIGLEKDIEGRDIIVIEDIIDTGTTMHEVLKQLHARKAGSVRIATLFLKPEVFVGGYHVDYIGIEIPNDFIVGYGLDYDEAGRNLRDIYSVVE